MRFRERKFNIRKRRERRNSAEEFSRGGAEGAENGTWTLWTGWKNKLVGGGHVLLACDRDRSSVPALPEIFGRRRSTALPN
jgi:hypothetical protein